MKHFETLREAEFARLDHTDHVYLDFAAAGLHPASSLDLHMNFLQTHVITQPGSPSPASTMASDLLEKTRAHILSFFKADPEYYNVIFTPSASEGARIVGERYPFRRGSTLALLADNHSSVVALREPARVSGVTVVTVPLESSLRAPDIVPHLKRRSRKSDNLFAYPAQSNFSGVHHPLLLVDEAHELGYDVLLDAAAFTPCNILDLSATRPDFVMISFYKMFGYPTGVGALLVRRKARLKLKIGTLSGGGGGYGYGVRQCPEGHGPSVEELERSFAPNVMCLPAVLAGLQFLQGVGLELLSTHVSVLTGRLLRALLSLRHDDGRLAVAVYGPKTTIMRGGTVTFNVLDGDGGWVDARIVQAAASARRVSVRVGCFGNVGAADRALDGDDDGYYGRDGEGMALCLGRVPKSAAVGNFFGAVRASVGIASNQADIDRLLSVVQGIACRGADSGEGESVVKIDSEIGMAKRSRAAHQMSKGRAMSLFGPRG